MTARLPRGYLRITAAELLPGESAWVQAYDLHVSRTGRVWLRSAAGMLLQNGSQPWPAHQTKGDYLVEATEEGLVLHVFKDNQFATSDELGPEARRYLAFARVNVRSPKHLVCPRCCGRRWIEEPDNG